MSSQRRWIILSFSSFLLFLFGNDVNAHHYHAYICTFTSSIMYFSADAIGTVEGGSVLGSFFFICISDVLFRNAFIERKWKGKSTNRRSLLDLGVDAGTPAGEEGGEQSSFFFF